MDATELPTPYPFAHPVRLEVDPAYSECRRRGVLTRVRTPYGDDAWLVSTHADIRAVLSDPRFSRAAAVDHDESRLTPLPLQASLLGADPPVHTRMRGLLAASLAFTGPRMATLRPDLDRSAHRLLDDVTARPQPVDLVEHFTTPLSVSVACDLMGVPYADRAIFLDWFEAFAGTDLSGEEVDARMARMSAYTDELLARRRANPGTDLVSSLATSAALSEAELVEVVNDLFLAGDNVATQLANTTYVLLTSPAQREQLRRDPDRVPTAVEELLRYVPFPSHVTFARYATEDVWVGGTVVRAGEAVLPALPSGNRDETVFANADALDITRTPNPHLSFGHGRHHCLGSRLVRTLLDVVIRALLGRLPHARIALDEGALSWRADLLIRRITQLPVIW